jgi:hypothetical protein
MVASLAERATTADLPALVALVDEALNTQDPDAAGDFEALDEAIRTQVLAVIRTADFDDIHASAKAVDELVRRVGSDERLRPFVPTRAWEELAILLSMALVQRDRAAIPSILRSEDGLARRVAEYIAYRVGRLDAAEVTVARKLVEQQLDVETTRLSKVLRLLEEAAVVARGKIGKEVHLTLGPVGWDLLHRGDLSGTGRPEDLRPEQRYAVKDAPNESVRTLATAGAA